MPFELAPSDNLHDIDASLARRSAEIGIDGALQELSTFVESHVDWYRTKACDIFPLQAEPQQHRLRRCVGLVQEVDTNAYFCNVGASNVFGGAKESEATNLVEALALYVVPVPGRAPPHVSSSHHTEAASETETRSKRRLGADEPTSVDSDVVATEHVPVPATRANEVTGELSHMLNLPHRPIHATLATACVATVLGHSAYTPQINDVVELFGYAPQGDDFGVEADEFEESWEWRALSLPPGIVSRMTVIHARKLPLDFAQPLSSTFAPTLDRVATLREHSMQFLKDAVCGGDALAAEYLLYSLISTVVYRASEMPVGDLPLFLWSPHLTSDAILGMIVNLRSIAPNGCVHVRICEDGHRLFPKKDHKANVLLSGAFQVAPGTTVVLDVTNVQPSPQIEDALFRVIHQQRTMVDFQHSQLELDCNTNVVIMGNIPPQELSMPVLRLACCLKLNSIGANERGPELDNEGSDPSIIREYLQHCRRILLSGCDSTGDDSVSRRIAADMTAVARQHPHRFNNDPLLHNNTLSVIVCMTRLRTASFGRQEVTFEDYQSIMAMECMRCER